MTTGTSLADRDRNIRQRLLSPCRCRTSLSVRGVTLLELLITLTILSMLGVIVLAALQLGSQSWQRGEDRAEVEQRIRVLHGTLAQQLAALQPTRALVDEKSVIAFRGGSDWIFFHTAPSVHGPFPWSAMVRGVAYSVEPGNGLVLRESYPLAEGEVRLEPQGTARILDPGVTRLKVRYLAPPDGEEEPRWVEEWDPREATEARLRDTNAPPAISQGGRALLGSLGYQGLPLAVEVTVAWKMERGGREVAFLFPIHIGRIL